jgi:taurine dioxygenase
MSAENSDITIDPRPDGFGAVVRGVNLGAELAEHDVRRIRQAWAEHGVLVFPDQPLDHAGLERFSNSIGPYGHDPYLEALGDHPHIVELAREPDEKSYVFGAAWHSDWSFQAAPPSATILHAKTVPPVGGDTLFADTAAAFDALTPELQQRLQGLHVVHSAGAAYGPRGILQTDPHPSTTKIVISPEAEAREVHPLLRRHPESGRTALFVNPVYAVAIEGLSPEESRALLGELYLHQVQERFIYRHRWQPDMLIMWDNRRTMHQAEGGYEGHRRVMHRTTIAGEKPLAVHD